MPAVVVIVVFAAAAVIFVVGISGVAADKFVVKNNPLQENWSLQH